MECLPRQSGKGSGGFCFEIKRIGNINQRMHIPVLQKEVIAYLDPRPNENFIDCTIGEGGHSSVLLEKIAPRGKVLGIDADLKQIENFRAKRIASSSSPSLPKMEARKLKIKWSPEWNLNGVLSLTILSKTLPGSAWCPVQTIM